MSLNITMMVAFSVLHQLLLARYILVKCQIVAHTPQVYQPVWQGVCCNGNNILKGSEFSETREIFTCYNDRKVSFISVYLGRQEAREIEVFSYRQDLSVAEVVYAQKYKAKSMVTVHDTMINTHYTKSQLIIIVDNLQ